MDRRVVIGARWNGEMGIFISPVGVDALYAADTQLLLSISGKISQLLKIGYVDTSQYVPLGFGAKPYILLTPRPFMSGIPLYGNLQGPTRPSPIGVYGAPGGAFADLNPDGSGMTIYTPVQCMYAVYNEVMP